MDKYGNKNLCFIHALISSVSFSFRTVIIIYRKLISRLIIQKVSDNMITPHMYTF